MPEIDKNVREALESFELFNISPESVDYKVAESYIPFFKKIDELRLSIIIAYDYLKMEPFYVSERFFTEFGFDYEKAMKNGQEYIRNRFHPDDLVQHHFVAQIVKYMSSPEIGSIKEYSVQTEFRVLNESGKYIRLHERDNFIELAPNNTLWIELKMFDFAIDQNSDKPATILLKNDKTKEIIFSFNAAHKGLNFQLTTREKEVLILISQGLCSKEIADKLQISANTVNNHRRNVILKLGVKSSLQAVRLAKHLEILN
jgi:DNA-binding CsgD family transcriptional regulator